MFNNKLYCVNNKNNNGDRRYLGTCFIIGSSMHQLSLFCDIFLAGGTAQPTTRNCCDPPRYRGRGGLVEKENIRAQGATRSSS